MVLAVLVVTLNHILKTKLNMERITKFIPAFDKRNPDPNKNYGIHGVELVMVLKGELGAVQFVLYTNWNLPHVTEELIEKRLQKALPPSTLSIYDFTLFTPQPADLGYHSLIPKYEEQVKRDNCPYLDGKPCYYNGSGLNAQRIYDILLYSGSDGVWKELEEFYEQTFGELK
jgi:hypothetical protein